MVIYVGIYLARTQRPYWTWWTTGETNFIVNSQFLKDFNQLC